MIGYDRLHETIRKSRSARSPSENRSPAVRAGNDVDRGSCCGGCQCVLGTSVEGGVAARWQAVCKTPSGPKTEAFGSSAIRIGCRPEARDAALGIRTVGVDRTAGTRHDPAPLWRAVPPHLCAPFAASTRLESAEADTASARAKRNGNRPLEPRELAAAKKRASNGKLAWYFSMKVASCCSLCVESFGLRRDKRRSNESGIVTIGSLLWRPLLARRGPVDSACITNSLTTTHVRRILFGSCARFIVTCGVRSFSCVTAWQLIAPPRGNCCAATPTGFLSNGFQHTPRSLIPSKTCGISPNTAIWPTPSPTISTTCTRPSIVC